MDPISLVFAGAAAGGVAGKIAEKATEFVLDLVRGQDAAVQKKAAENAGAFLTALSAHLSRLEESGAARLPGDVDTALGDPDLAATVRTAIVGAARTDNPDKHAVLARAVAERLAAASESNEALASSLAVDAIPKLSAAHLRFLGIAAVIFVVRPDPRWFLEIDGQAEIPGNPSASYAAWLAASLKRLHLGVTLDQLQLVHLVSTGCITYERKLMRNLEAVLSLDASAIVDSRSFILHRFDVTQFLFANPIGRDLAKLWAFGLEHATLTPAGRLVGIAVYDAVGRDPRDDGWSTLANAGDQTIDDTVWDGRTIREDFLKALDRAVRDRAERGVAPWAPLD